MSKVSKWSDATVSIGDLRNLLCAPRWREGLLNLAATAAQARSYGDLAGCLMLLDGRADAWLEAGVKSWDIAALKILVEEAGGVFSDFGGIPTVRSGTAIATNRALRGHILSRLNAQYDRRVQ